MYRTYLQIPFQRKEEAKAICRDHRLLKVAFDDGDRRQWFYPSDKVPPVLSAAFPVLDLVRVEQGGKLVPVPTGPVPIWAFEPTEEQVRLINTEPGGPDQLLVVHAFAGGSKTTSLRAYARSRPNATFLYLAFGKENAKNARETFPPNTTCSTIHALAYKWLSPALRGKVVNDFKADKVCELLHFDPHHSEKLSIATMVLTLLHGFWASSDIYPASHHLGSAADHLTATSWSLAPSLETITLYALRIWESLISADHPAPLTHEAYLKLYALSNPVWRYDYILLDEAQDTNPVTEGMVFAQPGKKIIVGDPHQNVYTFRRARDILTPRIDTGSPCLRLTNSFRFGPQVADLANVILSRLKGEKSTVVGRGRPAVIHVPDDGRWSLQRDGSFKSFTWISRSNATLFDSAVEIIGVIEAYEQCTGKRGPNIAFVGTSDRFEYDPFHAYKFGRLLDLVRLGEGDRKRVHDPFIARYPTIQALRAHVTSSRTADPEIEAAIRIYQRYKRALPVLIGKIGERCEKPDAADTWVRFSTAHKCKGLEWDRVRLSDDFLKLVDLKNRILVATDLIAPEEVNLLYVAATRAKIALELNCQLAQFLVYTGHQATIPNFMPGTSISEHEPVTWVEAVKFFGGNPDEIRARVMAERQAARSVRLAAMEPAK